MRDRGSAVRLAAHVLAPSMLAHALPDSPAGMLVSAHDRGGHFIPCKIIPGAWVDDLRRTFRGRR